jgi:hypothetical protein
VIATEQESCRSVFLGSLYSVAGMEIMHSVKLVSPDGPWEEMVQFLGRHNKCLDWVLFGDPTVIILRLAANTSSVRPARLRVV